YILANHKLYDGTVDEVAPPEHEPEPPKEPTPEELAQAAYEQCKSEKGASACYSECKSANSATCTLANGVEVNKFGDRYVSYDKTPVNFNTAVSSCEQKGMQMLSKTMFDDMYSKDKDFIKNNYNGDIWLSDAYSGDHESCVRIGDCHYYVIERGDEYIYSDNHFNHGTFTKSVICVAD
ncbi:hypothetical protein IJV79_01695, partial [bacterium]|nr:hypothetical protein [bacterium]